MMLMLVTFPAASGNAVADTDGLTTLWAIGESDNSAREFLLGPDGWESFDGDAFYIVGRSEAKHDWPYVHPGPSDIWAEGREHKFTVLFGLGEKTGSGVCRLTVDLVDTHRSAPPELEIVLNGYRIAFAMPNGGSDGSLNGYPDQGREYRFSCTAPSDVLNEGINTLAITNKKGSWVVYDAIGFEAPPSAVLAPVPETAIVSARSPQVLVSGPRGLEQIVRIKIFNSIRNREAVVSLGESSVTSTLPLGESLIELTIPSVTMATEADINITADSASFDTERIILKPVRKWEVYFLPHSHVDIGYTHLQAEVEKRQWQNISVAIDIARKTADYPEGARFKWNTEVLWAVDGLMERGPENLRRDFVEAVGKGWIGIDALYGSMLTGLARPEELFAFTSFARGLRRDPGIEVTSAMITDVPGYVWGMVPALALSGVRYFSPGPNHMPMLPHQGDRIGYTSEAWGDKPFWWVSPSGEERVLVWIPTHGYSWFHDWILGSIRKSGAEPILDYLDELDENGFPYDMAHLRYTIGADNGPPDPDLPEFVREWNEKYAYPRMVIATTGGMFGEFERRYGDVLPEYRGDFTPYWEDGAASTALETALNRNAAERLVQAQALWAMIDPAGYPAPDFAEGWKNVILYTEHTWGAHNSISDPENDFVKGQWAVKRHFATAADSIATALLDRALAKVASKERGARYVDVYNANSWERTDLVILPASWDTPGERIVDADGNVAPSQRLSSGELAFLARDVPPMGSKRFAIRPGGATSTGKAVADGATLSNGTMTAVIDPATGGIGSFTVQGIADELSGGELNAYRYLPGKDPKDAVPNGPSTIRVGEPGPFVASLVVESSAPGARSLTRELRIVDGLGRIDIINTVDKLAVRDKESVHFGFPFNVPGGQVRYDVAWGIVRPDRDQLPGGNRNVFSVQRWADVSNARTGVTLAMIDTPLMEIGGMNAEEWNLHGNRPWLTSVPESQTLYSYVMNNYWHTNYKAYQEGPAIFRYSIMAHGAFDAAGAKRFGIERSQPLIPVRVDDNADSFSFSTDFLPDDVIITSIEPADGGGAFLVRLFNTGEATRVVRKPPFETVWISDPDGNELERLNGPLSMKGFGIVTLRLSTR